MLYRISIDSSTGSGDDSSDRTYNFDWGALEQGQYEMSMSFFAEGSELIDYIFVDLQGLGCSMNNFVTSSPNTTQKFSNTIGVVKGISDGLLYNYYCMNTDNPPIYLTSKPNSNQFRVQIRDPVGDLTDLGVKYILSLSLKKL